MIYYYYYFKWPSKLLFNYFNPFKMQLAYNSGALDLRCVSDSQVLKCLVLSSVQYTIQHKLLRGCRPVGRAGFSIQSDRKTVLRIPLEPCKNHQFSLSESAAMRTNYYYYYHHNRFTAIFPRPPRWAGAIRELLDFMVQGKINRGRHTDHPDGRHSIWTKQCPPPPSLSFYRPDALPAAQPTVSKNYYYYY